MFDEGVTETLKNCIAYETTIEAGVLKGDFGVYSEKGFKRGKGKNVLISDGDFYIGKRKTEITDTVKEGYPFFAGHMTFVKNFFWKGNGGNGVKDGTDVKEVACGIVKRGGEKKLLFKNIYLLSRGRKF